MRAIGWAAALLLAGCAADGPGYSGQHGIIVYRDAPVELGAWQIEVDGRPACDLHPRSFFVVDKASALISASKFTMGTSRFEGREGQVVRIGLDTAHTVAAVGGGVIGTAAIEGVEPSGPFGFTVTDAGRLAGLHQDCL